MDEKQPLIVRVEPQKSRTTCRLPCRYVLALLSFWGMCVTYSLRVNLSIALVAMVNSTYANANAEVYKPECKANGDSGKHNKDGEFKWDQETQGIILGAFFYGYIVTQIPGGWLASRFGGKHLFGLGVLCTSVFTLLTPWVAHQGVGALVALRVLEGLGEGMAFPSINALWSSWAPPLERSKLVSITFSGSRIGTILAMGLSGFLCDSDVTGGWPSVFYLFGAQGILWFIVWTIFIHEKPAEHPRISIKEKDYILTALGSAHDVHRQAHSTPWISILTSPAVYAILVVNFCTSWGFYIFLTTLPMYFQQVLNMNIAENGVVSAIPNASAYIFIMLSGVLADWLQTSQTATTAEVRKIFTLAGLLAPACLLVANSYVGCNDKTLSVVIFTIAVGLNGLTASGFLVNHLDIAPRYAGLLVGLSNTAGTLSGIIAPYVTGWIINNQPTRGQWQKVFYLAAIIYAIGGIVFLVFGSANQQPWNTPRENRPVSKQMENGSITLATKL